MQQSHPQMHTHSQSWYTARKRFFIALAVWLCLVPLAVIIELLKRPAVNADGSSDTIIAVMNITSILLGVTSFFAWIPAVVLGIKWANTK